MVFRLLASSLFVLILQPPFSVAQTVAKQPTLTDQTRPVHASTARIAEGDLDGTGVRIADDLGRLTYNGNELRVITIEERVNPEYQRSSSPQGGRRPLPRAELKTMLQKFVDRQQRIYADREELFNQFVRW
ncbi:MAG: hypothetical protein WBX25_18295 [Rhodomicrobium sp.]